jgi:hypothetical protein
MKHHIHTTVVAALVSALVAAGGTYAASRYVVTSTSQIKPSVLHAIERVQTRTVETSACNPSPCGYHTVPGPQGDRGVQGAQGIQGAQGATGPTGPRGCNPAGLEWAGAWEAGSFYKQGDSSPCEYDENTVLAEDPKGSHEWWRCAHGTVVRFNAVGCVGGPPSTQPTEWERIF